MSEGLPEGWVWTKLGEVTEKAQKVDRKNKSSDDSFLYIDIGSIDNTTNKIIGHKEYKWSEAPSRAQQIIKKGDVLFSTVRTYLKNIAMVDREEYENQICSSGFTVIRGWNGMFHQKIFFYYSISNRFLNALNKLQTGTSYPAVRDEDVFNQPFPLPPLPEQHVIVEIIEEKLSSLDHAVEELKKAKEGLATYRQSVLKWAFEGKLSEEWREAHKGELETAEELLERIKRERAERYERELEDWKKAVKEWEENGKQGKKPTKPKRPKETQPLTEEELKELPELPEGWGWVRLGDINEIIMGQSPPGESYNTDGVGVPLINGPVEFGPSAFSKTIMSKWTTSPSKMCKEGDLILCVRGSTTGRQNIAGFEACLGRGVAAIKAEVINQMLVNHYFVFLRERVFKMGTGTTFPNISYEQIASIPFPLGPLPEQHFIVSEIERRLSLADRLEKAIDDALERSELLRQSILKKAFEGELTRKWREEHPELITGENSAEALLERIRKEKEESGKGRGAGRRRTDGRRGRKRRNKT